MDPFDEIIAVALVNSEVCYSYIFVVLWHGCGVLNLSKMEAHKQEKKNRKIDHKRREK